MIQPHHLKQVGCAQSRINLYAPFFAKYSVQFGVTTPKRIRHFLAQILHESGRLRYAKEIWGNTTAQLRYEGRASLGNTQKGDGNRFMGRGLIQVTGRFNYAAISKFAGVDFVLNPEWLELPEWAVYSAFWYWSIIGGNRMADGDNGDEAAHGASGKRYNKTLLAITKRVNGGYNGLEDRAAIFAKI